VSETDRAPFIRLSVDQEVFIDTVRDGDAIDDANVATEVTSFDRVGDAYVLEGAIVFAGYLTRTHGASEQVELEADALAFGFDDGEYVQHVHHRMPFVLRVPVKSQQRGIVNVASRIAGWKLSVISAGWIRVVADLNVVGLNGGDGYHFQCGAQEEGDVFFGKQWPGETTPSPSNPVAQEEQVFSAERDTRPPAEDFQMTRGTVEEHPSDAPDGDSTKPADHSFQAKQDALSEARGGHQEPETEWVQPAEPLEVLESATKNELADLDRRLGVQDTVDTGTPDSGGTESPQEPSRRTDPFYFPEPSEEPMEPFRGQDSHEASGDADGVEAELFAQTDEALAFEFEHQVSSAELQLEPVAPPVKESFVASRSFSDDGFHPTSGFVPTVNVTSQGGNRDGEGNERSTWANADDSGNAAGDGLQAAEFMAVDTTLWSFVDLSVPERYFTMRYAIVMEEETIETVSERLGCAKADILRVNGLSNETVSPGQTLKIPQAKMVVTR
jgi:hypothetical protein